MIYIVFEGYNKKKIKVIKSETKSAKKKQLLTNTTFFLLLQKVQIASNYLGKEDN